MDSHCVYAVEFATRQAQAYELFLRSASQERMTVSYCFWVITGPSGPVLVDLGFRRETARSHGRELKRSLEEGLALIGIEPASVEHVIPTHFHWDHAGNAALFPRATFYAQQREMAFWAGPYARYPIFRELIEAEDLAALVQLNLEGRLVLVDGSREILPGIRLHLAGGHTPGTQIVEVATATGPAVIASDAVKSYRHLAENRPDTFLHDVPSILDSYELVRRLAGDESRLLPGHDPEVLKRFKPVAPGVVVLE